jgi:hypothetical protein
MILYTKLIKASTTTAGMPVLKISKQFNCCIRIYLQLLLGHDVEYDGDHGTIQFVLHNSFLLEPCQPPQKGDSLFPSQNLDFLIKRS